MSNTYCSSPFGGKSSYTAYCAQLGQKCYQYTLSYSNYYYSMVQAYCDCRYGCSSRYDCYDPSRSSCKTSFSSYVSGYYSTVYYNPGICMAIDSSNPPAIERCVSTSSSSSSSDDGSNTSSAWATVLPILLTFAILWLVEAVVHPLLTIFLGQSHRDLIQRQGFAINAVLFPIRAAFAVLTGFSVILIIMVSIHSRISGIPNRSQVITCATLFFIGWLINGIPDGTLATIRSTVFPASKILPQDEKVETTDKTKSVVEAKVIVVENRSDVQMVAIDEKQTDV